MAQLKLEKHPTLNKPKGPVVIIVADGVGWAKDSEANAVTQTPTPTLDGLTKSPLFRTIAAHGRAVGMPTDSDMGNSEVGHNALGAGRIFDQGATLVNQAITSERIFETAVWKKIVATTAPNPAASADSTAPDTTTTATESAECRDSQNSETDSPTLHLLGLHSDGNVHAHTDHLYALLRQSAKEGIQRVRLHLLLDGRDTPYRSALGYLETTETLLEELNAEHQVDYRVASGGGRMSITMDRYDADWPMVERGYRCHCYGEGQKFNSAKEAIETMYAQSTSGDQYLDAFVITEDNGEPVGTITDGDAVIFTNFRGDRAIEISRTFTEGDTFDHFNRDPKAPTQTPATASSTPRTTASTSTQRNTVKSGAVKSTRPRIYFAGMLEYDADRKIPENYLVDPPEIDETIGHYLATQKMRCFAISETQKYGHVTFFWNGNRSEKLASDLETYVEIPSDNVEFDTAPEMKAKEIADTAIELIESGQFDWGRINFANGDMVGHTGNLEATKTAVTAVDTAIAKVIEAVENAGGTTIVLADHGNADIMFTLDETGQRRPHTSHTLAPVPFVITGANTELIELVENIERPGLANVAATTMNLLGFKAPENYEPSLIKPRNTRSE